MPLRNASLNTLGQPGAAILPVSRSISTNVIPSGTLNALLALPGQRPSHETGPDWQRRLRSAEAERLVVVEPDPDDRQQLRREADEPGVAQVVGGSRLASGIEREPAARAPAPVPSLNTLRIMLVTRKVVSGRATVAAPALTGSVLPAGDDARDLPQRPDGAAVGKHRVSRRDLEGVASNTPRAIDGYGRGGVPTPTRFHNAATSS